jgi:hypothetical protein
MPIVTAKIPTPLLTAMLFGFASLVLAEKTAEPSDDFLAYLGDLEDEDDNWADLANDDNVKSHSQASSASSASSSRSASSANGRSHT